jgi:hypothetical protein
MKNQEQKYATRRFNILKSAEGFKKKVNSNCEIKVYKDGKFGVRFKIDKSRPKQIRHFNENDPTDFDSEINGFGTNWHTAEDL